MEQIFLIQISKTIDISYRAERPPSNCFALADYIIRQHFFSSDQYKIIRKYWFSSYQGSGEEKERISKLVKYNEFEPVLFQKDADKDEKGVDIALTKEMLVNAFNNNFDECLLIAGDEDYVVLVEEVKRYGVRVHGAFIRRGLSEKLQLSFDTFKVLEDELFMTDQAKRYIEEIRKEVTGKR
jgi:uncharacterized LabA/DUF88 family protein